MDKYLVLVPETGLTPQITAKLREYLSTISVYWHSQLSDGQKSSIWGAVYNSEIKVVIGTRSAMFLLLKNPENDYRRRGARYVI